jgi:hypothetical protein
MATYNNSEIRQRIDSEQNWQTNNPTLSAGEIAFCSDKNDFKVGAGNAWINTAYMIANNPAVTAAQRTADNAQKTANTASQTANTALSRANEALSSSGRRSNTEVLNAIVTGGTLTINSEFVGKYKNYNLNTTKAVAGGVLTLGSFGMKPSEANEICFNFVTGDGACKFTGARMTSNIDDVSQRNKLLVVFGDKTGIQDSTLGAITFKANSFVKIKIVDTWYIKVDATSLS